MCASVVLAGDGDVADGKNPDSEGAGSEFVLGSGVGATIVGSTLEGAETRFNNNRECCCHRWGSEGPCPLSEDTSKKVERAPRLGVNLSSSSSYINDFGRSKYSSSESEKKTSEGAIGLGRNTGKTSFSDGGNASLKLGSAKCCR